jgi:hypothetical protein
VVEDATAVARAPVAAALDLDDADMRWRWEDRAIAAPVLDGALVGGEELLIDQGGVLVVVEDVVRVPRGLDLDEPPIHRLAAGDRTRSWPEDDHRLYHFVGRSKDNLNRVEAPMTTEDDRFVPAPELREVTRIWWDLDVDPIVVWDAKGLGYASRVPPPTADGSRCCA